MCVLKYDSLQVILLIRTGVEKEIKGKKKIKKTGLVQWKVEKEKET